MSVYVGEEANAYYIEEVDYGTTPGTPAMQYIGVIQDAEPGLDPQNKIVRGIGSRDAAGIRRTVRLVDLKLIYVPRDWAFWAYVGNDKSMSLEVFYEKGASIISLNHKGSKIDATRIEAAIEDVVKISADLIGQNLVSAAAKIGTSYEADTAAEPIMGLDCVVKKDTVEITRFSDFVLEIKNNLKPQPVIRATTPYLIKACPRGKLELSGSITADFESKAELDEILADTDFTLAFEIGAGAQKRTFTYSDCKWRKSGTPTKIEDTVAQRLEFDAKTLAET